MSLEDIAAEEIADDRKEDQRCTNQMLVLCYRSKAIVLERDIEWSVKEHLVQVSARHYDPFLDLEDVGCAFTYPGDGVWVCKVGLQDSGPGDWPGYRECELFAKDFVAATIEQLVNLVNGEWPWDRPSALT